VADETLEDYALRYTPKSFRKWSELLIANTALGSISFLALEAIGASIAIHYGFATAFWAILSASIIIFITAIPISYHAAKYNIDIDLITRSAGFGYVGSTITSLIYASFSFIFFALEAAIMAQALLLYFGLPLVWGYLLSSLIIIPLVFYGITLINKLQLWSQPVWLLMMISPFIAVLLKEPEAVNRFVNFSGILSGSADFNLYYFGFALGISLSLIAQIGEQVDYLRFMPPLKKENRVRWWLAMLAAGPGWILIGFLKQMGGIFLAAIVLLSGLSLYEAKTPIQMYYVGYQYVFDSPSVALAMATLFVVISQIKINVTNAYAGSLAWSNFFSRVTHSHPGRVVWMVFNIGIALLLMELGVFDVLARVLGLYSNIAIAWISAITADLIINKPLGLSPKIIEFKRAYLYNINPVGVVSTGFASIIAIISFMGFFGEIAQSYSAVIAMLIAFILAPIIAWLTKGKYYIDHDNELLKSSQSHYNCQVCNIDYEQEDMAYCPLHKVHICSLCCSLDSLCHDRCKKDNKHSLHTKIGQRLSQLFAYKISVKDSLRIFDFTLITTLLLFFVSIFGWMIYTSQSEHLNEQALMVLKDALINFFVIFAVLMSLLVWWLLLQQESRERAEEVLAENNYNLQQYLDVVDEINIGLFVVNEDFHIRYMNKTMKRWFGDQSGKICYSSVAKLDKPCSYCRLQEVIIDNKKVTYEPETPNGQSFDIVATPIKNSDGTRSKMEVIKNITDRKIAQESLLQQKDQLEHLAHHDILTGLPNRLLFNDRLTRSIEKSKRRELKMALLFIDLDHFKEINDSLGHDAGDVVLKEVAQRLKQTMRKEDSLARLGGDEFTIIIEDLESGEHASVLAQKIISQLAAPINFDNNSLYISSSIGISLFPDDGSNPQNLLKYADSAMYKAKDEGRNNFQYYRAEMTELACERVHMEAQLRQALKNNDFVVYYQPQIDGRANQLIGMEALVRWQHSELGMISPAKFIPLAETTGLIVELDRLVMKQAMQQMTKWYHQNLNPGQLALNLAIKQLRQKDFIDVLLKMIKDTQCQPQWLELEVTESQLMTKPLEAIKTLKQISEIGIQLAIDDFGTGYSSLSYLKKFPLNKLKIDQSFIQGLPDDDEDSAITKTIIALAQGLNLKVIAEGVETKEQKAFLIQHGCAHIQGYFYSKPMSADEMTAYLKNSAKLV